MKIVEDKVITIVDEDTKDIKNEDTKDLKQIITKVTVKGSCDLEFNKNEIKSDTEIEVKIDGDHVVIEGIYNNFNTLNFGSNSFSFGNFSNFKGNSVIVSGGRTIINGIDVIEDMKNKSNKKIKDKEEIKNYDMKNYCVKIKDIKTEGQSKLDIDNKIIDKESLEVRTSGQSAVKIKNLIVSFIKIITSGQSKASIKGTFDSCILNSSGQSSISGLKCTSSLEAESSGQSDIKVSACKGCSVSKYKSRQSSIKITEVKH